MRDAEAEVERLRNINKELVRSHNALLIALVRSEDDANALRDELKALRNEDS